jgi:hypothetical protein
MHAPLGTFNLEGVFCGHARYTRCEKCVTSPGAGVFGFMFKATRDAEDATFVYKVPDERKTRAGERSMVKGAFLQSNVLEPPPFALPH